MEWPITPDVLLSLLWGDPPHQICCFPCYGVTHHTRYVAFLAMEWPTTPDTLLSLLWSDPPHQICCSPCYGVTHHTRYVAFLAMEWPRYVSANTTLQKYVVYISVFTGSFLCSHKTAPIVVLHTEAKVLLLSQNGSDWSARPPLTFLEGERSAG